MKDKSSFNIIGPKAQCAQFLIQEQEITWLHFLLIDYVSADICYL